MYGFILLQCWCWQMLPQLSQFQQTNVLLEKPDVVNYSPFIPNILQINRLTKRHGDNGATKLEFFELSNEDTPQFSQEYVSSQRFGCGNSDKKYESLLMTKNCCALCLIIYVSVTEVKDWLKCLSCLQWFYETSLICKTYV